ncbi:hypothetical protein AB1Y20_011524 [Prymnesium parvum]|uniref:Sulfotransferase domain-containing protein n=1 Tax=Prymnesium parvum TaxID=97485 RepID=A0AB34IK14_PRYPA
MAALCAPPLPSRGQVALADNVSRTVLISSPSAGPTQAAMLVRSLLNQSHTAEGHELSPLASDRHAFEESSALCHECAHADGWTCVRLLRSPLDRLYSSYVHTMTQKTHTFPALSRVCRGCSSNASFAQFVSALAALRNSSAVKERRGDEHLLPQTPWRACGKEPSRLLSVPLEAMPAALLELKQLRVLHRAGAGAWPSDLPVSFPVAPHGATASASSWPWPRVKAAMHAKSLPPYDSFLSAKICATLSCLFAADFSAWTRMCAQPELRQCRTCTRVCSAQLTRFQNCGGTPREEAQVPRRRFVMWMSHRTGSSWTIDLLMRHPHIVALIEMYNDKPPSVVKSALEGTEHIMAHALRSKPEATVFGFKIRFNGSEESPLYAAFGSTPVICSFRRNVFDKGTSNVLARQLVEDGCKPNARVGISNLSKCTFASSRPPISVDPEVIYAEVSLDAYRSEFMLRNCQRRAERFPTYFLWYEDLVDSPAQEYARLEQFLGVPHVPLPQTEVTKIVAQPLDQIFSNWDAIVRRFLGSPFECMLASSTQLSSARKSDLTNRTTCAATAARRLSSADAANYQRQQDLIL